MTQRHAPFRHDDARLPPELQHKLERICRHEGTQDAAMHLGISKTTLDKLLGNGIAMQSTVDRVSATLASYRETRCAPIRMVSR